MTATLVDRAQASVVPPAARAWWGIAAALTTVSLGMPWRNSTLWPMYNVYNPWNCGVNYGGEDWANYQWCFQALPTYSWYEGGATPGYQTSVRLFVPLALLALFVGVRLARRRLMVLGAVIASAGAVLASTSMGPGQTLFLLGVAALWIGLHRAGVIRGAMGNRAHARGVPAGAP